MSSCLSGVRSAVLLGAAVILRWDRLRPRSGGVRGLAGAAVTLGWDRFGVRGWLGSAVLGEPCLASGAARLHASPMPGRGWLRPRCGGVRGLVVGPRPCVARFVPVMPGVKRAPGHAMERPVRPRRGAAGSGHVRAPRGHVLAHRAAMSRCTARPRPSPSTRPDLREAVRWLDAPWRTH